MTGSGRQVGEAHVAALTEYLEGLKDSGAGLPARAGKVNFTAVAKACGFNREVLYQNPNCKALLEEASLAIGLGASDARVDSTADRETAALERRISTLEKQNGSLMAEVHELRRRLRQFEAIEAVMVQTGKRVVP